MDTPPKKIAVYLNQLETTCGTNFQRLTQAEKIYLLDFIVSELSWNVTERRRESIRPELKEDLYRVFRYLPEQTLLELMKKLIEGIHSGIEIEFKIEEMYKRFHSIGITAAFSLCLFTILPAFALWIPALMLLALTLNTLLRLRHHFRTTTIK